MTDLLLEYDESVDAAYLTASDDERDHQEWLDDARGVNFAPDGSVIGIESSSRPVARACSWKDCRSRKMWRES